MAAAFVVVALAPLAQPSAASAADPPVVTGAVFNNPKGTAAQQNAVKNHIIQAIGDTQSGRLIRVSSTR